MSEAVVTGRGVVTSLGEGADAFFDALLGRRSGVVDGVAPAADFDVETYLTAREARKVDRFAQLAIGAADQAIRVIVTSRESMTAVIATGQATAAATSITVVRMPNNPQTSLLTR